MFQRVDRRQFLKIGGHITAGLMLLKPPSSLASSAALPNSHSYRSQNYDSIADLSVKTLAEGIRARKFSSVELVQAYLKRIEYVNPWLNAVVNITAESALAAAADADAMLRRGETLGPLHGIPMTVKDSLNTAGVVTTWSVPSRSDFIPDQDATVVARLKAAGAILLGKTNTPELTLSFETNSPIFGPTNNPYDIERTAGGSSGGSAAIVAASGSPFDIGSDTGGSVRVPCHYCGVAGIRPTSGRVPRTGNAIGPGGPVDLLTTIGPIARYVEDLELILPLISGPDEQDPMIVPMPQTTSARTSLKGLRGTFHTDNGIRPADDETTAAVHSAVKTLTEAGVKFVENRPPGIEESMNLFVDLMAWGGVWRTHVLQQTTTGSSKSPRLNRDVDLSGEHIDQMIDWWDRFRTRMLEYFSPYELIVCPANALPAIPHGLAQDNLDAFSYTMTYSLTGWPAAVVRAATSPEGLPIGIQIVARPWGEKIALSAAARIENELGGWKPPSL
jgi:amidase